MSFICRVRRGYSVIDDCSQEIEGDETYNCYGYKRNGLKKCVFHLLACIFGGIPYLFVHWYKHYSVYFTYTKCALSEADIVLLMDSQNQHFLENVITSVISSSNDNISVNHRYFYHHMLKYVWDENLSEFKLLKGLDDGEIMLCDLLDRAEGFSADEQEQLLSYYGMNKIAVEVKSYSKLFVEEVLNPFYVFQLWSIILWCLDDYYYYAGCVMFLCVLSLSTSLYQTRSQSVSLHDLVASSGTTTMTVLRRNGKQEEVPATNVVPGDIIVLPPHGCVMGCDAVLLTGTCIVNESMLTGESVPVTKTPPPHANVKFDVDLHKRHTLFSGTEVLQTRFYNNEVVKAVVVRTGFLTTKGELVRSILYPKPMGFKFYADSMKFVMILFITAIIGMSFSIYLYVIRGADIETILLRTLDILTIVVPPALPAAMTVGSVYSQKRLSKLGIFCTSPSRINVCGKVKLVCFDKTGTLTEDGLDFMCVIPVEKRQFSPTVQDVSEIPIKSPLVAAMACCHSLTIIDGQLKGDPLDISMFEATKWIFEEPGPDTTRYDTLSPAVVRPQNVKPLGSDDMENLALLGSVELPYEIGIVRQFPFSSAAQCMSVITRDLGSSHMRLFCKGAPEKVIGMCAENTVPLNFSCMLTHYTSSGFRVLAFAHKDLEPSFSWRHAQRVKREQIETDLIFTGLLIMQNTLKPETAPVINQLQNANIRCLMVTGDNILTAVCVARDSGMIPPSDLVVNLKIITAEYDPIGYIDYEILDTVHNENSISNISYPQLGDSNWHYVVDGHTWSHIRSHFPELVPQVVTKGAVFARMSPDQKTQLVEALQSLDYVVAMVGDGANDCGALRTAHVGVSLSEAEASVAAPFTSRSANIQCIVHLLCEGRCSLVTSFGVFKYMSLYSLTQFVSILILYLRRSILGNMQFLFIDLIIVSISAFVISLTGPSTSLVTQRPIGSLLSAANMVPLVLQVILIIIIQISSLLFLKAQPWYKPFNPKDDELIVCWDNTVLFTVSSFQYLILAAVCSKGPPHRKPFYSNKLFVGTLIVLTIFNTLLMVYPIQPLASFFELVPLTEDDTIMNFRYRLLLFPLIHCIGALFIEFCIAETQWLKRVLHWVLRKQKPKNKYKGIIQEYKTNPNWRFDNLQPST